MSHQRFLNNRTDGSSSEVVVFDWLSDVPSTWAPLTGDWDDDGSANDLVVHGVSELGTAGVIKAFAVQRQEFSRHPGDRRFPKWA